MMTSDVATGSTTGPERVLAELRELAALTGGPEGSRRLCWSPTWGQARDWLRGKLAEFSCEAHTDAAGNLWAAVPGRAARSVVVGSHVDSVPNGGWLDGALGVVSALDILRRYATAGEAPPVTVRLVDWADEEGARFGRSLFGSSAAAGTLDPAEVRERRDAEGAPLPEVLARWGVDLDRAHEAGAELDGIGAYLELHIEQGPVLEQKGLPIGAVLGTFGVERHAIHFHGRTNHAGSTPLDLRHDAYMAAARLAPEARESARRRGGVATFGTVTVEPGIVTAIPGRCTVSLDQRALDPDALAGMLADARDASARVAAEEGTTVEWEHIWRIEPIPFDPALIGFAREACREVAGVDVALPSGALHDAAEMARRVPTVMLFSSSNGGVSHNRAEDTPAEHLALAIRAHSLLADKTVAWVAANGG